MDPRVPLFMGFFSGKNTAVGCHFFLQGPASPAYPALAGGFFTTEPPGKTPLKTAYNVNSSNYWNWRYAKLLLIRILMFILYT